MIRYSLCLQNLLQSFVFNGTLLITLELTCFIPYSNGDVRVNWMTVTKNGSILKTGDIVSVSGKGRLKVAKHQCRNSYIFHIIESSVLLTYALYIRSHDFLYLQIGEINSTKRGKFAVELIRYL